MRQPPPNWAIGNSFNNKISLMGGILSMIVVLKVIEQDIILFIIALVLMIFYSIIETKLVDIMEKMTNSSSFYFETPYFLIPWGLVMLLLSLAGLIVYHFHKQKDYNLFLTYIASLDVSLIIFCIATSLKCFLVGTKMVSFKYIRRGFFGVFERFFVLLRGVLCTFRWLCYFSNIWPIPTLMNFIARPKTTSCYIYIVMKCILLLWLLWDLAFSIQKYRVNSIVAVKAADPEKVVNECVICLNMPVEPVQLSCSHIFCYECAIRWLSLHPTCPMCAQPIAEQKYIEFSDGHIPLAALLSAY